jgi:hypothetical protein
MKVKVSKFGMHLHGIEKEPVKEPVQQGREKIL